MAETSQAVPSGPCFLYGNHCNRWDPFVLNCFTPWSKPTAGVMTQEFFRKGFLRWALSSLDLHPTRKRTIEPRVVRAVRELLAREKAVVIYPEGGSRWAGRPEPWIESTAKMFSKYGYPVHPIVMHGSYVTWPRWATYPRPGRIEVEVLPEIEFDDADTPSETLTMLQRPIDVDENVAAEHLRPKWAYRPADGIHKLLYKDPRTGEYGGLSTLDGTVVTNRDGSWRLTMLPDSRLRNDRTGEIHTTGDLYESVRQLPLEADKDGVYLSDDVDLSLEIEFPDMIERGAARAQLRSDAVLLHPPDGHVVLPIEQIRSVDIERNYKLQITLSDRMMQLSFTRSGSALAWADGLEQLMPAKP